MKNTTTLDAGGKTNRTTKVDNGNGRLKNLPSVAVSIGAVAPTGRLIESGNNPDAKLNGKPPAPIACPACNESGMSTSGKPCVCAKGKAYGVKLAERDAKNSKAKGSKAKTKTTTPFVKVETPPEAKKLAAEFRPDFTADCLNWLVLGKSGQMRVVDVPVIAVHLLSKKTRYIFNEIPDSIIGTDKEKEMRQKCGKTLKDMRASFRKLIPSEKAAWLAKAKPLFNRSLREFLQKTLPIKRAIATDKRFKTKTALVFCSKKGIVNLGTLAQCRDFVAERSE
jgi:hypothetical protein